MALRFIEGFEAYHTVNDTSIGTLLPRKGWTSSVQQDLKITQGRITGKSLKIGRAASNRDVITTPALTAGNTWIIGFAINRLNNFYGDFLILYGSDGSTQLTLSIPNNDRSAVAIKRSTQSYEIGRIGPIFESNRWAYIEIKFYIDQLLGYVEFKKDGTLMGRIPSDTVGSLTSTNVNKFTFQSLDGVNTTNYYLDDLYICDSTGSNNNDYLGPIAIEMLQPTGTGANSGWVPSTNAAWSCVDDIPCNDDTDYATANAIGQKDTYNFSNLSSITGNIKAIEQFSQLKSTGGSPVANPVARVAGTDYDVDVDLSVISTISYQAFGTIIERRPSDNNAWTISDINNGEFGLKLKA